MTYNALQLSLHWISAFICDTRKLNMKGIVFIFYFIFFFTKINNLRNKSTFFPGCTNYKTV